MQWVFIGLPQWHLLMFIIELHLRKYDFGEVVELTIVFLG